MSKTVTIPSNCNPFIVVINNVTYSYVAGSTVSVPDDVAEVIANYKASLPQEAPGGNPGDVWTKSATGAGWEKGFVLKAASTSKLGGVKMGVAVADPAGDAPTAEEFESLLESLRNAGIIAPSD